MERELWFYGGVLKNMINFCVTVSQREETDQDPQLYNHINMPCVVKYFSLSQWK